MKSSVLILALMGSCLLAQGQTSPQPSQQPAGSMQQPAAIHPQQPSQQQTAPAGQPPASMPQQGAPAGQQPASGAQSPGQSNVASTLHVYAYPKNNQSPDQQFKDETACYQSAQGAVAPTPESAQQQSAQQQGQAGSAGKGTTAKGAAGGAATGAAIGAVAGDAGEGAAIGAMGGTAVGHRKKKKAKQEAQKEEQQQQQAQQAQVTDNVKRAYAACMEARNYIVK
jgi:hypothetical protein